MIRRIHDQIEPLVSRIIPRGNRRFYREGLPLPGRVAAILWAGKVARPKTLVAADGDSRPSGPRGLLPEGVGRGGKTENGRRRRGCAPN